MKTRDSKGQNERWRGTNFVPQISVWFSEIIYCFFLLVCKIYSLSTDFKFAYMMVVVFRWNTTESNPEPKGQWGTNKKDSEGQILSLTFQCGFSEMVLLFFFLLVCDFLSPICPFKAILVKTYIDNQLITFYITFCIGKWWLGNSHKQP